MKSLSDTSIFKYTETLGSNKITTCLKNLINEKSGAKFPSEDDLEDIFYRIRHKSFNYSAKFDVIDLYRKGIIKLVYNPEVKLTVAVPFFKYKMSSGGLGVIVNITNYAKIDKDGKVKIDPLILYTLMLSGAFSLVSHKYSITLCSSGLAELYSELAVAMLSKIITLDSARREMYKFIFGKFLYIQAGESESTATKSASKLVKLDESSIENIDLSFPATVYDNLENLINHIKNIITDANSITLGIVFDKWMKSYGEFAAFAIEDVTSFISVFIALITNCNNLINIKSIEKCANRHSSKLVTLFNHIESIVSDMNK